MKKIYLLITPLIIIAGCKKDHSSGSSTNPANYELVAYASYNNGTLVDSVGLTYTSNTHLLNSYTVTVHGGASTNSSTYQLVYSSSDVLRINLVSESVVAYYNYHYNIHDQVDSIYFYTTNTPDPVSSWGFKYNSAGQVSDEFDLSSSRTTEHESFTYDAAGNLNEELDSSFTPPLRVDTITYSNYDNKVNPIKAMPGYPNITTSLPEFGAQFFSSPNNYGTVATTIEIAPGQYGVSTTNLSYQYNTAGLPTAIIDGLDTVRLTYKQF
jgi:hypothetical protein